MSKNQHLGISGYTLVAIGTIISIRNMGHRNGHSNPSINEHFCLPNN
ncbi:hypothetical protein [Emticicia aquatica]|nr:hypothetical protein [Emticicia aquatica]